MDMSQLQPRKKTAFSIRDLLGLQQQQEKDPTLLTSRLSETHDSCKLGGLSPIPTDNFFSHGVRLPGLRYRGELGGYPHWRGSVIDTLSSGQTILNFNIFSAATAHCDVFKPGQLKYDRYSLLPVVCFSLAKMSCCLCLTVTK